ncbi:MAG: response regulator [Anaerocolumna sp.]
MYRVILVDDEIWILQGIQETFHWSQYDMEVIGAYTFATEAMKMILEKKPDIVFTDIRMPIINGFELINRIREAGLETEIVIISGYGQFDYAKEAMRGGAFDFVLKPLNTDETDSLLQRLKEKLDQKYYENKKKLFEIIMDEPEEVNPRDYHIPASYKNYQVGTLMGDEYESFKVFLDNIQEVDYVTIEVGNKQYFIMNSKEDITSQIYKQEFSSVIGLSAVYNSSLPVSKMISQSGSAALGNFITGQKGTYQYKPMEASKITPLIVRLTKLLDEGQLTEFQNVIHQIPEIFKKNQYSVESLCFVWNRILMHIELLYPEKFAKSELELLEWYQLDMEFEDIESMFLLLKRESNYIYGTTVIDTRSGENEDSTNFSKILWYVNQHYKEQIKLKDISQKYYINKNYACYLFKRNTGMSYSDYLNKIRMEHAKKLLVTTDQTIFEISELVGYIDYSYFSKAFKKKYGVTPTQYRKMPLDAQVLEEAALN